MNELGGNGPAQYYKIPGYQGKYRFYQYDSGKSCGTCNRIRLTAQGELKPCLCYGKSYDLRNALRRNLTGDSEDMTDDIRAILREAILEKPEQHCFEHLQKITEEKTYGTDWRLVMSDKVNGKVNKEGKRFVSAVITLSDKGFAGEREDKIGPLISQMLSEAGYQVKEQLILPDEQETVRRLFM